MFDEIDQHYGFLNQFGYHGPVEYNIAYEIHKDYVKGNLVISVAYDGGYWVSLFRTRELIPALETGHSTLKDLNYHKDLRYYDLTLLDSGKRILSSVEFKDRHEKMLWYYSKLLKDNPDVLNGDLTKFTLKYRLLKRIGMIKQ